MLRLDLLPSTAMAVVALGHAAWVPMVLLNMGPGPRLAAEAFTLAALGAVALAFRGHARAHLLLPAGFAVLAAARFAVLADVFDVGLRGLADGLLVLGLAGMAGAAAAGERRPWAGALLAAAGAFLWLPQQVADNHLGWSAGTVLQVAGWLLLAWTLGSGAAPDGDAGGAGAGLRRAPAPSP